MFPLTTVEIRSQESARALLEGSGNIRSHPVILEDGVILPESLESQEKCFGVAEGSSRTLTTGKTEMTSNSFFGEVAKFGREWLLICLCLHYINS